MLMLNLAVGCSNLIPPEDAWIKREDDKIIIGCYTSRQTWQLRCHDGRWTGVVSNCSHDESQGNYANIGIKVIVNRRCVNPVISHNIAGVCHLPHNFHNLAQCFFVFLSFC